MFRRTRAVFAAFLGLSVVTYGVGAAGPASAAYLSGSWVGVSWTPEAFAGGSLPAGIGSFECGASFSLSNLSATMGTLYMGAGFCRGGADVSPFICQIGEAPCTEITVTVKSVPLGATPCADLVVGPIATDQGEGDSITHTVVEFDGFDNLWPLACDPTQACIDIEYSPWHGYNCVPLLIDVTPPVDLSCSLGTFHQPVGGQKRSVDPAGITANYAEQDWWFTGTGVQDNGLGWIAYTIYEEYDHGTQVGGGGAMAPADAALGHDLAYTVYKTGVSAANAAQLNVTPDPVTGFGGWVVRPRIADQVAYSYGSGGGTDPAYINPPVTGKVIGVGIYNRGAVGDNSEKTRKVNVNGRIGSNDPGNCSFYWGKKLFDLAGTTVDTPAGEIPGDPVAPTDPPVSNPFDPAYDPDGDGTPNPEDPNDPGDTEGEPTTDMGWLRLILYAIRSLFGLLGDIVSAITGLVADLIAGLLGLLAELFIPNPASWGTDEVMTQLEDAGPTNAIGEVSEGIGTTVTTYRSAGDGCGVLFTTTVGEDTVVADTCTTSPTLATLRAVVSAGLVVITGIGIVKMVAGVMER